MSVRSLLFQQMAYHQEKNLVAGYGHQRKRRVLTYGSESQVFLIALSLARTEPIWVTILNIMNKQNLIK